MKTSCAALLVSTLAASSAAARQAPPPRPLTTGQTIADSLAAGAVHAFSVDLAADRFVLGEVDQRTVDVAVRIVGPDGAPIAAFDGPSSGAETFQFTGTVAGTYRIEVRPFENGTGRYAIRLDRVEPRATSPDAVVDQMMARYSGARPGGVVAVVRNGGIVFAKGYGMADLEYDAPNTPATPWHMASVSKQFTAFAIALLADQGRLSLDDDVRTYIPELHDFGPTITLRHLLHHTSGFRDHWTLWTLSGGRMDDVIRQEDLLRLAYDQRELNFPPGSEYLYSNTGFMLLSEVVVRVTGQAFGDWMREHVFGPLGMDDTQVYDDHARIVKGRAYSYESGPDGLRKAVLSYANAGATSLFTTAEDLARWLRNMHTHELGGRAVWAEMTTRGVLTNGDTIDYALGLGIGEYRGLRRISHGGADAGYRTMLAFYPEIDAGVIVLGNIASFNAGQIADGVADAFFEDSLEPVTPPVADAGARDNAVRVAAAILDAIAGDYRIQGGPAVRFTREGDGLVTQIEGQPSFPLTALADTMFRVDVPNIDARVSFHIGPDGAVDGGVIHQGGGAAPIRRESPWTPGPAELQRYAGRFYSPELETFYTVRVEDGRLVAWHRRHGTIALTPNGMDTFRSPAWFFSEVRFERDAAGGVTGMRVTSGRVRNLKLEKVAG